MTLAVLIAGSACPSTPATSAPVATPSAADWVPSCLLGEVGAGWGWVVWGWTSAFAIAPVLGAAGVLAGAVEVLLEVPLVGGVEDVELLSASDLCASWMEDASRSPVFVVAGAVAVLAAGADTRSGKRLAVCGGRLAVVRADWPSEADEVRSGSAAEVESFLEGVETAAGEGGWGVMTGVAAGVAAMLAAVAGEELTAACTAAAIAACWVSALGVVVGWVLAGGVVLSETAGAEELRLVGICASAALLSACVGGAGVADAGVAGEGAAGAGVACEVAASSDAERVVEAGVGVGVEAAGLAAGIMPAAVWVRALCEAGVETEPAVGTGSDAAGGVIALGVTAACAAGADFGAWAASGSSASVAGTGARGSALACTLEVAGLVADEDGADDAAGKVLDWLDDCLAGRLPALWTVG